MLVVPYFCASDLFPSSGAFHLHPLKTARMMFMLPTVYQNYFASCHTYDASQLGIKLYVCVFSVPTNR